ncbi:hypothetical protein D6D13_09492 [Aureobasidium pullulans]|uniref:Uncharacterized protein n=1 Tax=Aureobasidium pullulans TaxID=5580 RepID=A0A4S9C4S3_AURPU|nr:hypothetical protein D6D13_09492 [Aureobasidium pullulans]
MTAVIGGDIQPSFSRILMSLIILPPPSWRAVEYSIPSFHRPVPDHSRFESRRVSVRWTSSLVPDAALSAVVPTRIQRCSKHCHRRDKRVQEHDRAVLAAKPRLLAAEVEHEREEAVPIGDGTL